MTDQFSNMSFQNKGLKGHMFFEVRKSISSTIKHLPACISRHFSLKVKTGAGHAAVVQVYNDGKIIMIMIMIMIIIIIIIIKLYS